VDNLTAGSRMYTSNAYFIRGDWNKIKDVNAMIDVGRDPEVIEQIEKLPTGLGKKRLERVVLTHSHYDHVGMLEQIKQCFNPEILAMSPHISGVDHILEDGDEFQIGDSQFQILHCPGHSSDSICLLCGEKGVLFSGDTPLRIQDRHGVYDMRFVQALQRIAQTELQVIYPGHGPAITNNCQRILNMSLDNLLQSKIVQ
jgi:glyoxylase-like metal-dependent hydrolase (beta-lactamase superfamily II)